MRFEKRAFPADLELEGDSEPRLTGYAAVFDSPSEELWGGVREVIRPGAFTKTLQEGDIRALWNHNTDLVLGGTRSGRLQIAEDGRGLRFDLRPRAGFDRELDAIRGGDVDGMSFGFRVIRENFTQDEAGDPVRELLEVALREISPTPFPAYLGTDVQLRSQIQLVTAHSAARALGRPEVFERACAESGLTAEEIRGFHLGEMPAPAPLSYPGRSLVEARRQLFEAELATV